MGYTISHTKINIHCLDIILGIQNENRDVMLDCLNYCIMYAKVFISECKYNEKECDFYEYQKILKNVLDGEIVSYKEITFCHCYLHIIPDCTMIVVENCNPIFMMH